MAAKKIAQEPTEKQIEQSIISYLNAIPGTLVFKYNAGGVFDPTKRIFRKNHSNNYLIGVSDILGIYQGKFIALEVKRPSKRKNTTAHQKYFLFRIIECGGYSAVVTSIDDVISFLKGINDEKHYTQT